MQMRKKIKEERASMAVYVGVVLMSFLLLLTATYIGAINVRKTQLSTIIKIKESYEKDNGKAEEIYNRKKKLLRGTINECCYHNCGRSWKQDGNGYSQTVCHD